MQEKPISPTGLPSLVGLLVLLSLAAGQTARAQTTADAQGRVPPGMVVWETAGLFFQRGEQAPASPELLAAGEALYGMRCAICHGKRGDGEGPAARFMASKPRNFRRGIFKFRTAQPDGLPSERDLFRSITAGFPAYGMPSYRYLSDTDRLSLVHHVKALVAAGAEEQFRRDAEEFDEEVDPAELREFVDSKIHPGTPLAVPDEPKGGDSDAVARGRKLFQTDAYQCVRCHGPGGQGDGPSAKELKDDWGNPIRPRNYTLGLAYRKVALRRQDVVRLILLGIPGTPMPSNSRPTESSQGTREAWDVAAYVEHLTAEIK